jgi:hypothetical protein
VTYIFVIAYTFIIVVFIMGVSLAVNSWAAWHPVVVSHISRRVNWYHVAELELDIYGEVLSSKAVDAYYNDEQRERLSWARKAQQTALSHQTWDEMTIQQQRDYNVNQDTYGITDHNYD